MMDSPVGIAAWLVEKFNSWSDTVGNDVESAYCKEALLTNLMVSITTRTFNTASWTYYGCREKGGQVMSRTASASKWLPRWQYFQPSFGVATTLVLGAFAAIEEPELLLEDVGAFARTLR